MEQQTTPPTPNARARIRVAMTKIGHALHSHEESTTALDRLMLALVGCPLDDLTFCQKLHLAEGLLRERTYPVVDLRDAPARFHP